jgi:hypothetical protein
MLGWAINQILHINSFDVRKSFLTFDNYLLV